MATNKKDSSVNTAPIKGRMSTSRVMFELWERNSDNLTKEQLEWFAYASEHASMLAQDMQGFLDGLGCLISEDGSRHKEIGSKSGDFQSSEDVPNLLFFISRSLNNIQGLIEIGDSASNRLIQTYQDK